MNQFSDNNTYASLPKGVSSGSTSSGSGNSKAAEEAHLLSQATSTAVVAAKSILMAGGSDEVALRTAKAAAESVLNPSTKPENDNVSMRAGRTLGFLRKRKYKRQAEVVASMALATASNSLRHKTSSDWSSSDANSGIISNPFTKNITTEPMGSQDEPSVLSSQTKFLPKPPLMASRSNANPNIQPFLVHKMQQKCPSSPGPHSAHSRSLAHFTIGSGDPFSEPTTNPVSGSLDFPSENVDPSTAVFNKAEPSPFDEDFNQCALVVSKPRRKSTPNTSRRPPTREQLKEPIRDAKKPATIEEGLFDDETTIGPSVTTHGNRDGSGSSTNKWRDFDPLMDTVANVFNLLTCSPVGAVDSSTVRAMRQPNGIPKRIMHHNRDYDTIGSAIDTLDDRTDGGTEFQSLDSYDDTHTKDHRTVSSSSSGESSVDSTLLHELPSCSITEPDINVRSSVRDSMEKIVARSRKSKAEADQGGNWEGYELKKAEASTASVSLKSSPKNTSTSSRRKPVRATLMTPKNRKKGFFFNKK